MVTVTLLNGRRLYVTDVEEHDDECLRARNLRGRRIWLVRQQIRAMAGA